MAFRAETNQTTIEEEISKQALDSPFNRLASPQEFANVAVFLVSPAASGFIEQMAARSNMVTQKRFGKTIQLYIPMYLSNECSNQCIYCGFNSNNLIDRITLSEDQILCLT